MEPAGPGRPRLHVHRTASRRLLNDRRRNARADRRLLRRHRRQRHHALAELQLAFPFILLAITIVSITPPSLPTLIAILAPSAWVVYARVIRGKVLSVREQDFVEAARALGADTPRLLLRHILPQLMPPIIVIATLELGRIIVLGATMSFLGFGVQPPTSAGARFWPAAGRTSPRPGGWPLSPARRGRSMRLLQHSTRLAIALLVLAINTDDDWLAEVLDPSIRNIA